MTSGAKLFSVGWIAFANPEGLSGSLCALACRIHSKYDQLDLNQCCWLAMKEGYVARLQELLN